MSDTLKQNLELRKALAEVDRLTSENILLKEMVTSLEIELDDVNTIVKNEMGYIVDHDEFMEAADRIEKRGGFPKV
tara:strand:+ start:12489 stop:12716 length:228 start_codon:yes stop_codon:yes gene_type:complete